MDIGQVRGQITAKAALLIAAAGRHNILLTGPPGNGKSTLVKAMDEFQARLYMEEYNALVEIYRKIRILPECKRPFIEVSPQVTETELLGGGHKPTPGSISLAHSGILFMDEFPQYDKKLLERLRQPIETGRIGILRGGIYETFLADFQLVAAMNPCPCGYDTEGYTHEEDLINGQYCTCTVSQIQRYRSKLSGPILDRIDMVVSMKKVDVEDMFKPPNLGEGNDFRCKVEEASIIRMGRNQWEFNSKIKGEETFNPQSKIYLWTKEGLAYLKRKATRYSARKLTKLAKVSRTIADLRGDSQTDLRHIRLAASFVSSHLIG